MPARRSNGRFVYQCPNCSSRSIRALSYQCLKCKEEFIKPTRQTFRTQADALRAHGFCAIEAKKKAKEFFVDVCPACETPLMLEHKFKCVCGELFDRNGAVLLWEVEGQ